MDALSRMLVAVRPDGLVLDLQVIRPDPQIELNGSVIATLQDIDRPLIVRERCRLRRLVVRGPAR